MTPDEQRVCYACGAIALHALVGPVPEFYIYGGGSSPRGWPEGHWYEYKNHKGWVLEELGGAVACEVKWSKVRAYGKTLPASLLDRVRAHHAARVAEGQRNRRTTNRITKGDDEAQPWSVKVYGPINEPALNAEWERHKVASSVLADAFWELLAECFPLALEHEPQDLLELLAVST